MSVQIHHLLGEVEVYVRKPPEFSLLEVAYRSLHKALNRGGLRVPDGGEGLLSP